VDASTFRPGHRTQSRRQVPVSAANDTGFAGEGGTEIGLYREVCSAHEEGRTGEGELGPCGLGGGGNETRREASDQLTVIVH